LDIGWKMAVLCQLELPLPLYYCLDLFQFCVLSDVWRLKSESYCSYSSGKERDVKYVV